MWKIDEKSKKKKSSSFSTVPHNAQSVKSRKTPSMQHKEERKSYVFRSVKDKQMRGESGHLPHLCCKFLCIYHVYISFVPSFLVPQHKHPSKHMRYNQPLLITLRMTTIPMLLICLVCFLHKKHMYIYQANKMPTLSSAKWNQTALRVLKAKTKIRFENLAAIRGSITGHVRVALSF